MLLLLNPFKFCQLNSVCDLRKVTSRVHCYVNKLIALFFYFWLYFTITVLFAIVIGVLQETVTKKIVIVN